MSPGSSPLTARFWGTRGSIPSPGRRTLRFGGNTLCTEVRDRQGRVCVLDAGSGIFPLGQALMAEPAPPTTIHVLLTHTHWDHIQGLPFFLPAYVPGNRVVVHGPSDPGRSLRSILEGQMARVAPPWTLARAAPQLEFVEHDEGRFTLWEGLEVTTRFLHHTALCLGYRLEGGGRAVTYATDVEPHLERYRVEGVGTPEAPFLHREDNRLVDFARGSDLYIQDAMYGPQEYPSRLGWGHSPCTFATEVALAAGARRFALYHHDPVHDDDFLEGMAALCRELAAARGADLEIFAAAEGMEIAL